MIRGVGLRSAVAVNVVTMIGAGPLVTIPLVVVALHGSVSVAAWIAGAVIALCDGLVYAELASRLPRTGGTYAYLREAYGSRGAGRLLAFLFVWQFCFWAPLILASGYIGFAQYAGFLVPALAASIPAQKALAVGVGILTIVALYRAIPGIARTAYMLGFVAVATLAVVAFAGLIHPHVALARLAPQAFGLNGFGLAAFGAALVITLYDYGGYNDVCAIAEEVRRPERTIPLAIVISVVLVAASYVALNLGVFSTLPVAVVGKSTSVASDVVAATLGHGAAVAVTVAILVTAFASTYGLLLGASRIPFAAAREGDFLAAFAQLHPTAKFPARSLLALGLLALPAALLPLDAVIAALTAGIVLVQGVAQIGALAILRWKAPSAAFRIPLYPLPPLVALGGWLFLFYSSGRNAMAFGSATLLAGAVVFFIRARRVRSWPFAAMAAGIAVMLAIAPHAADAETFTHSAIVQRADNPTLVVDGKPFFFYGAAFFYERIPAAMWRPSMTALKAMGFNTLDVYVPWNWHELSDGDFDFEGRTNPSRNLREVLRLGASLGFKFIVRPGPVIRNEWRNGGYPAWLLTRPEYGMPLHDVLEGRYPATATLQNANADDAAAEWMNNQTHMRYAARWLQTALREFGPVAGHVLAVQLDDDQGAYIDNQTWPAPHFQAYLGELERIARRVTGPQLPVFINTYQMKVTASAPVWAMGNWYQSDAYSIGEHDRTQLEFSTGLLQTQTRWPVAISEFQAGWLAPPEDPTPRPADPTNTALALHTMLGFGARGVIDFPPQDTTNPAGWEAPFANASYAWDAALTSNLAKSERYGPTREFGDLVTRYGRRLATAQRIADGAIAYMTSAFDAASLDNAAVFAIAARTQELQRGCRVRKLTCDLVDLRYVNEARLRRYPFLVVPSFDGRATIDAVRNTLGRYARSGGRVTTNIPSVARPVNGGISDATVLRAADGTLFVDVVNYADRPRAIPLTRIVSGRNAWSFGPRTVAARGTLLFPLARSAAGTAISDAKSPSEGVHVGAFYDCTGDGSAPAVRVTTDSRDGFPRVVLSNRRITATISPNAGARLVALDRGAAPHCLTDAGTITSVGALRDDVEVQPPPSTTDRIAKYTHSFPAGMFNRPYRIDEQHSGDVTSVRLSYDAPDVVPNGALFERTISLATGASRITVDQRATFRDGPDVQLQRAVSLSSFNTREATVVDDSAGGSIGFFSSARHMLTVVAWRAGDVEDARIIPQRTSAVVRLRFARGGVRRTVIAIDRARTLEEARAMMRKERDAAGANPPAAGEVAKW
ncbi:MAG: amino acid permease [Candidatus Velthaea sp.]